MEIWETILDVLLDALKDSAITLAIVFAFVFVISFFEKKITSAVSGKNSKFAPIVGAGLGLIPQCGFSVVASDMYLKRKLTMGTLVAVYIACSDEALPIILANPNKIISLVPLLLIKFIVGFIVGILVDTLFSKQIQALQLKSVPVTINRRQKLGFKNEKAAGCCTTDDTPTIDKKDEFKQKPIYKHLIHPLTQAIKIFGYVLAINIVFGLVIGFVGEDVISGFLNNNMWLTPLFAVLVGLIPNCASSVILTELFMQGSITFAAAVAGLICNAGIGIMYLLKDRKKWRETLVVIGIIVLVGLVVGYITLGIQVGFNIF
jgi:hypothetical protein